MSARFTFVVEQTLGHVAHTANLERALARTDWVHGTVIKLPYEPRRRLDRRFIPPRARRRSIRATRQHHYFRR